MTVNLTYILIFPWTLILLFLLFHHFLQNTRLDKLVLLVSAAIHDYAHPGVSNGFLVTTRHSIATGHNDASPLERFHCAEAFKVLGQPGHRFDRDWSSADQRRFRHAVIQLVLSTDLGLGLGVIQQFDMSKEEIAGRCSMGGSLKKKKQLTLEEKGDFSIPVDGGGSETVDAPGRLKRTSSYGCESIFFLSYFCFLLQNAC